MFFQTLIIFVLFHSLFRFFIDMMESAICPARDQGNIQFATASMLICTEVRFIYRSIPASITWLSFCHFHSYIPQMIESPAAWRGSRGPDVTRKWRGRNPQPAASWRFWGGNQLTSIATEISTSDMAVYKTNCQVRFSAFLLWSDSIVNQVFCTCLYRFCRWRGVWRQGAVEVLSTEQSRQFIKWHQLNTKAAEYVKKKQLSCLRKRP